jgi:hypothetical protein
VKKKEEVMIIIEELIDEYGKQWYIYQNVIKKKHPQCMQQK